MREPEHLRRLLEPSVRQLGYELAVIEFRPGRGRSLLRLYIDSPNGVTVDDCAKVSRQVSAVLDVEDPIPGEYTLEVSSPGLDRPLARQQDFERYAGEKVKLKTAVPVNGRRSFTGRLLGIEAGQVVLDIDGVRIELPWDAIEQARLVPVW
jgi:ribosome maturation factor RimP